MKTLLAAASAPVIGPVNTYDHVFKKLHSRIHNNMNPCYYSYCNPSAVTAVLCLFY